MKYYTLTLILTFLSLVYLTSSFKKTLKPNLISKSPRKSIHNKILKMTDTGKEISNDGFNLAAWFNPNTRGGVIVWSTIITIIPVALYNTLVAGGMNSDTAGADVGFAFVVLSMVGWASTYLFRVANKDMTYARQLKDYENAVLQKRLEELADDEIQALLEEIELEDDKKSSTII